MNVFPLHLSREHLMEEHCTLHVFFSVGDRVSQIENANEKKHPEAFQRFSLASQGFPEGSGSLETVRRLGVH